MPRDSARCWRARCHRLVTGSSCFPRGWALRESWGDKGPVRAGDPQHPRGRCQPDPMAPRGKEPTLQQGPSTPCQKLRGEEGWRPPPAPCQSPQGTQARWAREDTGLWPAGGAAPGSSRAGGTLGGSAWGCVVSQRHRVVQLLPGHPSSANAASHPSRHAQAPAEPLAPSPLPTAAPGNLTPKPQDLGRQRRGARLRPHPVRRQSGGAPRVPTFSLAENGDPGLVGVPGSESSSSSRTLSRYPMASSSSSMACRAPLGVHGDPARLQLGKLTRPSQPGLTQPWTPATASG